MLDEGLQVQKVDHFQLEEQSYAEMVREVIVSGDVETLRGLLSERRGSIEWRRMKVWLRPSSAHHRQSPCTSP